MKRRQLHSGRRLIWRLGHPLYGAGLGLHIARQEPDGSPALRDERCWRNAAGLFVNMQQGYLFILVRNLEPKKRAS